MNVLFEKYREEDVPELVTLWSEVFGDDRALPQTFLELLPEMGTGLTARLDGKLIGAAYLLDTCLEGRQYGYLYAVAVYESYRGRGVGRTLCRKCRELCDNMLILPAEESLYAWYEHMIGTKTALFTRTEQVLPSDGDAFFVKIDAKEYNAMRERLLSGRPHFRFNDAYVRFLQTLCECCGGGLYRSGEGIACGYIDGGTLLIRECLGFSETPALCSKLGCDNALVRIPASDGEAYIIADPINFARNTVFNLSLD